MDRPYPFIQKSEDGKLVVNPEVTQFIRHKKHPVTVIAIVGNCRTGKSYIMNRFFGANSGFELGSTVQSRTKGIWIWAKPHPRDPHRTLILLDTEGLSDVEKGDKTHDIQLFCLAILLSNVLLYNTCGTLDDILIKDLHLVTELTEHIKIHSNHEENGNHFNRYFPSLVILLRDFFLKLEIDGTKCTANEYLENSLKLRSGTSKRIKDYNEPRECIRTFFPRRMCFTLCKPIDDDDDIKHIDKLQENKIKPEFLKQTSKFIDHVLDNTFDKKIENQKMNFSRFVELAIIYVGNINNGSVPCITSTFELLRNKECRVAMDESLKRYQFEIEQAKMPLDEESLVIKHQRARQKAIDHYHANALFDKEGTYLSEICIKIEEQFKQIQKTNMDASFKKCQEIMKECLERNVSHSNEKYIGKGGYQKYKHDTAKALCEYDQYPNKGPAETNVRIKYLENQKAQEQLILRSDEALNEQERKLKEEHERKCRQEEKACLLKNENRKMRDDICRQQNESLQMFLKFKEELHEMELQTMKEHKKDMADKEMEYRRLMEEGRERQAEQFKHLLESMQKEKKDRELIYQKQMDDMKAYTESVGELIEEFKHQKDITEDKIKNLQAQLDKRQKDCNVELWDTGRSVAKLAVSVFVRCPIAAPMLHIAIDTAFAFLQSIMS